METASTTSSRRYVLGHRIARGGMAEIFRARQLGAEGFDKEVVVKRILPELSADPSFIDMFIDEARLGAMLDHPHIVDVLDFDRADGAWFMVMEYVDGQDLKDLIDAAVEQTGYGVPAMRVVELGMQMADALDYAHNATDRSGQRLGLVHRDVSPRNIMVTRDGRGKLMDFGIAKAAERVTRTQVGIVKGKCAYMSPEQIHGKELDGRSDIFSLGVCLWEALTGCPAFAGENPIETVQQVLARDPLAPSRVNPAVPESLDAIILKAICKERDGRYASAEAFQHALSRWYFCHATSADLDPGPLDAWLSDAGNANETAPEPTRLLAAVVDHGAPTEALDLDAVASYEALTLALPEVADPDQTRVMDAVEVAEVRVVRRATAEIAIRRHRRRTARAHATQARRILSRAAAIAVATSLAAWALLVVGVVGVVGG